MTILTGIFMALMDIFMIVVLFCAIVLALIVLDYLLDSDLKDQLNRVLGKRMRLKRIRDKALKLVKKVDEDALKEEAWKQQIDIADDSWYPFKVTVNDKEKTDETA